jgi:DNA-binding MarR family transcriptional regulator
MAFGVSVVTEEITNSSEVFFLDTLKRVVIESVRADEPDLTARQLALLLTLCEANELNTVRGMAAKLGVSKPAITRAADRLEDFGLAKRAPDDRDRRSVLLVATPKGISAYRGLLKLTDMAWKVSGGGLHAADAVS